MKTTTWKPVSMFVVVAALAALAVAGCGGKHPASPLSGGPTHPPAGDDLVLVMKAQEILNQDVLARPGVNGTAITTGEDGLPTLVVMRSSDAPAAAMPVSVMGIPVQTVVAGPFAAFTTYAGTSTGNDRECAAGTLGALVTRIGSNGTLYWLSNNHVFARYNAAALGERIDAPGRYDAGCGHPAACGTLSAFEPLRFVDPAGGNAYPVNQYDAAIALVAPGSSWSPVQAGGTRSFRPTNTITQPSAGLAIKKIGRTTGFTSGTIRYTNASVFVNEGGRTAYFTGQFVTTTGFAQSGDSGSLVAASSNNNPVGLLFAGDANGTATVSPIGPVMSRFNIRFQ